MTTNSRTLEQVEAEIEQTKAELANVKGRDTEVYARIVGYYRSVRNWNKGKRDEYDHRKQFVYESSETSEKVITDAPICTIDEVSVNTQNCCQCADSEIVSYEIYTRKTCPNCPPVKSYMANVDLAATAIDVDSEEGFARASEMGVMAAPTVIFFDANKNEVARAHSVAELSSIVPVAIVA